MRLVNNKIVVFGDAEEVRQFSQFPFWDFDKVITMPRELDVPRDSPQAVSNMNRYGYVNWYGWRIDFWGTSQSPERRNVDVIEYGDKELEIQFTTISHPCIPIIRELSRKFRGLLFVHFFDDGEEAGFREYTKGILTNGADFPSVRIILNYMHPSPEFLQKTLEESNQCSSSFIDELD